MNKEEIRRRIGCNIVTLRQYYGISRRSLAMLIKMPENRLCRIEAGDSQAKLYDFHVKRIARVFGITVDELFDDPAEVNKEPQLP